MRCYVLPLTGWLMCCSICHNRCLNGHDISANVLLLLFATCPVSSSCVCTAGSIIAFKNLRAAFYICFSLYVIGQINVFLNWILKAAVTVGPPNYFLQAYY